MLRFLGFMFSAGCIVFVGTAIGVGYIIWATSKTLPEHSQLAQYEPPVMTRVHAADGSLLAEYADQRRLFVPVNAVPEMLINAFVSAEDKNFRTHDGLDWYGIGRAILQNIGNIAQGNRRRFIGASTITQQVAKNFLLTNERTWQRKLKEALLAQRIERAFKKDQILELYLNEIYLGLGAYGVAGASLTYFGKTLTELDLPQMAYLAALPKAPNNYHPHKKTEKALERRNWVLGRMLINKYITKEDHDKAVALPLKVSVRPFGAQLFAAESFAEEVRREVQGIYGRKRLYTGGLSVRTTLNPKLQIFARQALTTGLIKFDRKVGWRGAVKQIDISGDWGKAIADMPASADIAPWRPAVVLEVTDSQAIVGLKPRLLTDGKLSGERLKVTIPLKLMQWARKALPKGKLGPEVNKATEVLTEGDAIYVAPSRDKKFWHLVQLPELEGGLVAMDPYTGRVLAMVGGFSYGKSQFNRAVQARRQPGSSIKPFVYAAALDNGHTPASVIDDAPIEIKQRSGKIWRPQNYTNKFYGPSTLRLGIEQSRNAMTVRLANDIGIRTFKEFAERLGIYDNMPPVLSMSLGAGETTLMRMTTGYAMLANGGKRIKATLIDRIQDRYGKTIFRHDKRECTGCSAKNWQNQPEPEFLDNRETVVNPYTAYQVTSMLEGVVARGTGKALKKLGRPVAGKTGTTNNYRDAWFMAYSPHMAVGLYVGYDRPRSMGRKATGGELAAPIVASFLELALKDKPATPFRFPSGVQLIPIDPKTGQRAAYGDENVILEAFKPGEQPPDTTLLIGGGVVPAGGQAAVIEGGLTTGTGGLY